MNHFLCNESYSGKSESTMKKKTKISTKELTCRGFIVACILTMLFTSANVYLGLKVGMTFATSIPAAVISMSVLRLLKGGYILENNIVQTMASAAGTISAIVFILPAMVMLGFWKGFPFWQTFLLCGIGGVLGVMYTIPLRRTLVVDSSLPYPEGRAAAEILKVGSICPDKREELQQVGSPVTDITLGTIIGFVFGLISSGFKLLSDGISAYGKIGSVYTGIGFQLSFALVGAGYLIGVRIAIALLIGTVISWGIAVPVIAEHLLPTKLASQAYIMSIWSSQVRYIGAGTIGISAIWAFLVLLKPIAAGIRSSIASSRLRSKKETVLPIHEQDIPVTWVMIISGVLIFPLIAVLSRFISSNVGGVYNAGFVIELIAIAVFLTLLVGFLVAGVSGYMAGLVGSSYSPLSGIGIIAIVIVSLLLSILFGTSSATDHASHIQFIIALAIIVTTVIFSIACISNDNLQDLSTGHLIGATPWKQQVALIFGVIVGSLVLSPVLSVLYQAYGFVGSLPHSGMDPSQALNAPQATLMMALSKGIISHDLDWTMLFIGVLIGVAFLVLNGLYFNSKNWRISVLTIGVAIYLPSEITIPIILGGVLSYIVKRKIKDKEHVKQHIERCGTLMSAGFIVGTSLFGILLAVLIGASANQNPIALVGEHYHYVTNILGIVVFSLICLFYVKYILKSENKLTAQLKSNSHE